MLAHKILMPGNYPEESIQHSEHSESLESEFPILLLHTYMARRSAIMKAYHHPLTDILKTLLCSGLLKTYQCTGTYHTY